MWVTDLEDLVNIMSPTQGGLVCTRIESQPSSIVFGGLMMERSSPFSFLTELNYTLGFYLFFTFFICFICFYMFYKPWPGSAVYNVLFLYCSKVCVQGSKCKLTSCWCSVYLVRGLGCSEERCHFLLTKMFSRPRL